MFSYYIFIKDEKD